MPSSLIRSRVFTSDHGVVIPLEGGVVASRGSVATWSETVDEIEVEQLQPVLGEGNCSDSDDGDETNGQTEDDVRETHCG